MTTLHPGRIRIRRWRRQVPALFLLLILLAPAIAMGASGPLWGELRPGPHAVGFRRIWTLDRSRVWPRSAALDSVAGPLARPLRVDVWYPASACTNPMPLSRYLRMESPGAAYDDLVFLTRRWDEYSYRHLTGDSTTFHRLMAAPTAACWQAPPAPGRFPLVLDSAGWFNRVPDDAVLAEYLASHGFVVATVPQLNPGLWTFHFGSDARSVENQLRDLEVALGVLIHQPHVDRTRVAAMGYSTGGDVALLLQGRNPLVKVVVGLDASFSLSDDNDVQGSPFFDPRQHRVPLLAVRRPVEQPAIADAVLDSLRLAPRLVVEIPGANHGSFSDDPVQRSYLGQPVQSPPATHAAMARSVLGFLQATLTSPGPFDGEALRRRYQQQGLLASFRPAAVDSTAAAGGRR